MCNAILLTVCRHNHLDLPFDPPMMNELAVFRRDIGVVEIAADAQSAELAAHLHRLLLRVAVHDAARLQVADRLDEPVHVLRHGLIRAALVTHGVVQVGSESQGQRASTQATADEIWTATATITHTHSHVHIQLR